MGKRGLTFLSGGLQFLHKNKLKSEIFNNKKEFISKNIFVCHNCEFNMRNFNK